MIEDRKELEQYLQSISPVSLSNLLNSQIHNLIGLYGRKLMEQLLEQEKEPDLIIFYQWSLVYWQSFAYNTYKLSDQEMQKMFLRISDILNESSEEAE